MRTMTLPATFKALAIDDTTTATDGLNMLNAAIRRAYPDSERFSFHHSTRKPDEAYSIAKGGGTFWEALGQGRLVVYCTEGSEGYWVHVDVYQSDPVGEAWRVRPVLCLKTYGDLTEAQAITNLTQFLIGC